MPRHGGSGERYRGHREPGNPNEFKFQGCLDEIAIFSRALTGAEIQAAYDARLAGVCGVTLTSVNEPSGNPQPLAFAAPYPNPSAHSTSVEKVAKAAQQQGVSPPQLVRIVEE